MKARHALILSLILSFENYINGAVVKEITGNVELKNKSNKYEDLTSNATQLIADCGYVGEEHQVQTEDGYILTLFRIPNKGPVVFLMHGLLNTATVFLTLGRENSLACLLAYEGYDVWLGNARGNTYSRQHVLLSPKERAFWNYTFHEMGIYDLPAMIDYALNITNQSQLTYVGHTQGTTAFFIMASLRPEYGTKISRMISLASVAWLTRIRVALARAAVPLRNPIYVVAETLGLYEILPYDAFWRFVTSKFCPSSKFAMFICASILFSFYGYDYKQLNYTQFPVEIGHTPGGVSAKTFIHFAQIVASGKFQQFDHIIEEKNIEAYGSIVPPSYPVQNINVTIAIFYALNDLISVPEDVQELTKNLRNVIECYQIPFKEFNHMDYLWAKDAKQLVYIKLLQLLKDPRPVINRHGCL